MSVQAIIVLRQTFFLSLILLFLLFYTFYFLIKSHFSTKDAADTDNEVLYSFPIPLEVSRLKKFLPVAFPYLLLASVLSLISSSLLLSQGGRTSEHSLTMLYITIGLGLIPCAILHSFDLIFHWSAKTHHFISMPEEELKEWWKMKFDYMWKRKAIFIASLCFGALEATNEYISDYYGGSPSYVGFILSGMTILAGMVAGMALVLFFKFSLVIGHLGRLPLKVNTDRFGIMSVGPILAKVWLLAGLLYALFTSTAPLRPGKLDPGDTAMILLALPAGITIFSGLLMSQFGLHRGMVKYKEKLLQKLRTQLEITEEDFLTTKSYEAGEHLRHLREFYGHVSMLPEWPISWRYAIGLGTYSIGSFIPTALGIWQIWTKKQ